MRIRLILTLGGFLIGAANLFAQGSAAQVVPPPVAEAPATMTEPGPVAPFGSLETATPSAFYAAADYLLWWVRGAPLHQPLATEDRFGSNQGSSTDPTSPTGGGFFDPRTVVVVGGKTVDYDALSGARFTAGFLIGSQLSLEGSGFFLTRGSKTYAVQSDATGQPFIFQPVFFTEPSLANPNGGLIFAFPGIVAGGVQATQSTELWGAEAIFVLGQGDAKPRCLEWLAGFKYLHLKEDLQIVSRSTLLDPTQGSFSFGSLTLNNAGDTEVAIDRFGTRNQFYGGQLGVRANGTWGRFGASVTAKVALGGTSEVIQIAGSTLALPAAGGSMVLPGGVFAVASNSGRFSTNRFAVCPEFRLDLRYELWTNIEASVGYDFLYLSDVVRPGEQFGLQVNASQIPQSGFYVPGVPTNPAPAGPTWKHTDFWAQGLHCGLEFRY